MNKQAAYSTHNEQAGMRVLPTMNKQAAYSTQNEEILRAAAEGCVFYQLMNKQAAYSTQNEQAGCLFYPE